MRRRRLLQAVGTGLLGGAAGCSRVSHVGANTRLGDITFVNNTDSVRTVILYVERSGEPVFASAYEVPPSETSATTVTGGWPTSPGRYVVAVSLNRRNVPTTIELTDEGCWSLLVAIEHSTLAFFGPARDEDDCPGTPAAN